MKAKKKTIKPQEARLLQSLHTAPRSLTINELTHKSNLSWPTTSKYLKKWEAKGLIKSIEKKIFSKKLQRPTKRKEFKLNNKTLEKILKNSYLALFLFLSLLLIPQAQANFACGQINNINEMSASWFDVLIYDSSTKSKSTSCQVSPSESKFCCDLTLIEEPWQVGKLVTAEIYDPKKGYFTDPVSLKTSGEGYDIFPEMQLKEIITLHSPNSSILSKDSLFLNISVAKPFNQIEYELTHLEEKRKNILCSNCEHSELTINDLLLGAYNLTIIATNTETNEKYQKTIPVTNSVEHTFNRKFECSGCTDNYIPARSEVTVKIYLNISHEASGKLQDYFPADWIFVESDGSVESFSETHNVIKWQSSGNKISKEYKLISPNRVITRTYKFQTSFEDFLSQEHEAILFKFYRFFSIPLDFITVQNQRFNFLKFKEISPKQPFVSFFSDAHLNQIAIFPNKNLEDVYMFIEKKEIARLSGTPEPFKINSNIPEKDINKILIRFKVKKSEPPNLLKNATLLVFEESQNSWSEVKTTLESEDDNYLYFQALAKNKGIFTIKKEESISE